MAKGPSFGKRSSEKPHKVYGISKSVAFASVVLVAETLLVSFIIYFVPYTKIDWDAYMSQVNGFLDGERDYMNLKGDTGPLVYPAGFLYVYSAIKFVTAGQVFAAQILFGALYIVNLAVVLLIYKKTEVSFAVTFSTYLLVWILYKRSYAYGYFEENDVRVQHKDLCIPRNPWTLSFTLQMLPWWTLVLLSLSKRVHSIFMLRLFNDCVAMALLHAALALLLYQKWHSALIVFSAAVSVKMNVLLFAPPLLLLILKALSIKGILSTLSCAALIQILLGLPFLLSHPMSYISRAFNLGRVFIHFWSVNFKFVPEDIFTSKEFACSLLVIHLTLLLVFSHFKWCKNEGGVLNLMRSRVHDATSKLSNIHQFTSCKTRVHILHQEHIATVMFVGNFIGIICARSLHYQFYSWYFFSLPYLLWKTPFPTIIRIALFAGVELCWNVYPSASCSSLLLLFIHMTILWGLWISPTEHPYVGEESH